MEKKAVSEPGMIDDVVKWSAGGAGFGGMMVAGLALLRWAINWFTGRLDRKQERIDAEDREIDLKWRAYREALEDDRREMREEIAGLRAELATIRVEVERCHLEKREMADRLSRLEGFSTGRGEARQIGQIEQSARRVIDGEDMG